MFLGRTARWTNLSQQRALSEIPTYTNKHSSPANHTAQIDSPTQPLQIMGYSESIHTSRWHSLAWAFLGSHFAASSDRLAHPVHFTPERKFSNNRVPKKISLIGIHSFPWIHPKQINSPSSRCLCCKEKVNSVHVQAIFSLPTFPCPGSSMNLRINLRSPSCKSK